MDLFTTVINCKDTGRVLLPPKRVPKRKIDWDLRNGSYDFTLPRLRAVPPYQRIPSRSESKKKEKKKEKTERKREKSAKKTLYQRVLSFFNNALTQAVLMRNKRPITIRYVFFVIGWSQGISAVQAVCALRLHCIVVAPFSIWRWKQQNSANFDWTFRKS